MTAVVSVMPPILDHHATGGPPTPGRYDTSQLTVDQIARAVGSSPSTVYRSLTTNRPMPA